MPIAQTINSIGTAAFDRNEKGQQIFYWGKRSYIVDDQQKKQLHSLLRGYLLLVPLLAISAVVLAKLFFTPLKTQVLFLLLFFCIPCICMQGWIYNRKRTLPRSPKVLSFREYYRIAASLYPNAVLYGFIAVSTLALIFCLVQSGIRQSSLPGILLVAFGILGITHLCWVQHSLRKKF